MLRIQNYSRVPVYSGSLDNIKGLAFAHDLLQITDDEARTRTVATILHPAAFVPETKRGYELLREMQREKQHMRIVIDEYGAVAGLVTIEDLLEQIVGNIRDEHETDTQIEEPQREPSGSWLIPGSFPADQLGDVIGEPVELGEDYEAATARRPGERDCGPHSQGRRSRDARAARPARRDVASTGRRVERVRLFPPTARLPFPKDEQKVSGSGL
jgi:putative hemolysin